MHLSPEELPEALQPQDPRRFRYIRDELRSIETERRLRALRRFGVVVAVVSVVLALVGAWRWL